VGVGRCDYDAAILSSSASVSAIAASALSLSAQSPFVVLQYREPIGGTHPHVQPCSVSHTSAVIVHPSRVIFVFIFLLWLFFIADPETWVNRFTVRTRARRRPHNPCQIGRPLGVRVPAGPSQPPSTPGTVNRCDGSSRWFHRGGFGVRIQPVS
jgi:hypothetical protein